MTTHDRHVEELLPWFVNGTLTGEERGLVEGHLAGCGECRDLHAFALEQLELARDPEALEHVDPLLLVTYVEAPETLEADAAGFVEERLAACEHCRAAHEALVEVEASLAGSGARTTADRPFRQAEPGRSFAESLWARLARTLLHPVPALAYLVVLAVLVPVTVMQIGDGEPRGGVLGPVERIVVTGDRAVRGVSAPAGRDLSVPAEASGGGAVLVELVTDLAPADLPRYQAFVVEIEQDGEIVASHQLARDALVTRRGRVSAEIALYPDRLGPGVPYELTLRVVQPGSPLDGQALFRCGLVVEAAEER